MSVYEIHLKFDYDIALIFYLGYSMLVSGLCTYTNVNMQMALKLFILQATKTILEVLWKNMLWRFVQTLCNILSRM